MDGLQWKTLLKWMIRRYPYFWKHPNDFQLLFFGDAPPQTLMKKRDMWRINYGPTPFPYKNPHLPLFV